MNTIKTLSTFYTTPNEKEIKNYISEHKKANLTEDSIIKSSKLKQKVINKQINSFGVYLHKGSNKKLINSFYLPKYSTYNDIIIDSLEEFKKNITIEDINDFNFSEHLYLNESRFFFDVDFNNKEEIPQLEQLFNAILSFSRKYELNIYGLIEIQNEDDEDLIEIANILDSQTNNVLTVINQNQTKILSGHIFLNGCSNRADMENYMKNYFLNDYNIQNCSLFDDSVYKTTKQALRCSFSDKIKDDKSIRKLPKEIKEDLINDNIELLYQLRMAPMKDDKYIDLKDLLHETKSQQKTTIKQGKNEKDIKNVEYSIFQFVKNPYSDDVINLADFYISSNHYDFSKLILPYVSCVLSTDEIIQEIRNIKVDESNVPSTFIPFDDWIELVINDLKNNIKQDITDIKTLFTLKKYTKIMFNKCKKTLIGDKSDEDKIMMYQKIHNSLKYYITKYEKLNFVSHKFYDMNDKEHRDEPKKYRMLYNFYTLDNDESIYCAFNNMMYKNKTQLRKTFKMSGESIEEIYNSFVCFENQMEFQKLMIEYKVKYELTDVEKKVLSNKLDKFMEIFKTGFKFEDDYDYYLGFISAKLTSDRTINKGIINQGTETDPAINSFKTFFTDLLQDYIDTKKGDYKNINKKLNGTYFTGKLLIIEELPKVIEDADNFINILKANSDSYTLIIEEKGEKPRKILNMCDYIINTNNTVKSLFKNYNDCVSLLKRFRIITRQSIDMNDEVNELLDYIKENRQVFSYYLKEYLINKVGSKYFNEHKNVYNDVMKLYVSATSYSNETNKVSTDLTLEEFTNKIKTDCLSPKNYLRLVKLYEYLIELKALNKINIKTFKQNIIILLDKHITLHGEKKQIYVNDDEIYGILFNQYFEKQYDDDDDDNNDNSNNEQTENK